jgi:hypothetical protein
VRIAEEDKMPDIELHGLGEVAEKAIREVLKPKPYSNKLSFTRPVTWDGWRDVNGELVPGFVRVVYYDNTDLSDIVDTINACGYDVEAVTMNGWYPVHKDSE